MEPAELVGASAEVEAWAHKTALNREQTGCPRLSAPVPASNLPRLARAKPNPMAPCDPRRNKKNVASLDVEELWGGPVTATKLHSRCEHHRGSCAVEPTRQITSALLLDRPCG